MEAKKEAKKEVKNEAKKEATKEDGQKADKTTKEKRKNLEESNQMSREAENKMTVEEAIKINAEEVTKMSAEEETVAKENGEGGEEKTNAEEVEEMEKVTEKGAEKGTEKEAEKGTEKEPEKILETMKEPGGEKTPEEGAQQEEANELQVASPKEEGSANVADVNDGQHTGEETKAVGKYPEKEAVGGKADDKERIAAKKKMKARPGAKARQKEKGVRGHTRDEHAAGEHTADEHAAGEHTAGEHTAGEHTAGEHTAGEHTADGGEGAKRGVDPRGEKASTQSSVEKRSVKSKHSEVDSILQRYVHLKEEEAAAKRNSTWDDVPDELLSVEGRRFKIDIINFVGNIRAGEEPIHEDILFFFDSYEKKLKKKKKKKNVLSLIRRLFKCEHFELDGIRLVLQILDKIAAKLMKEIRLEQIVRCFSQMIQPTSEGPAAGKGTLAQGKSNDAGGGPHSAEHTNGFAPDERHLNKHRNKLYGIIFSSRRGQGVNPSTLYYIQQWNNNAMLIMLRDKLEEIQRRKMMMMPLRSATPLSCLKLLRRKVMCNLLNACCVPSRDEYYGGEFFLPLPPLPPRRALRNEGGDYFVKVGGAIRVLASK
ncbi:hypothetical protein PVBG_03788 [Plasmodium vivax Brazil I]|uniref:Uncharacterized protein n=1 Tax=Plasmodium vivax (strain Brazil I) TaxID=1033975 RepID=A0A0J9SZD4_PLAV1|nr:hypothetical protein PVBG_03788 [Plasmodium vivax Brazil I]